MKPIEIVPPSKELTEITLACIQALKDYEPAKEEILQTLKIMNRPVFLVDKRAGINVEHLDYQPGLIVVHQGRDETESPETPPEINDGDPEKNFGWEEGKKPEGERKP